MGLIDSLARELQATPAAVAGVRAARLAALAHAQAKGMPSTAEEDWKYTDLSALARQDFALDSPVSADFDALPLMALQAHRLVFVNGNFSLAHSALDKLPTGVTVRFLRELSAQDPDRLTALLTRQSASGSKVFAALNAAAAQDGVHLEIAAECRLEQPLLVIFLSVAGTSPLLVAPFLHLDAGAHSQATVIELHVGQDMDNGRAPYLTNAYTWIETARAARVAHYRVVSDTAYATHIGQLQIEVGADSEVENFSLALGGRLVRLDIDCSLAAAGGKAVLNGVFMAGQDQHIDHHTRIDHRASHTSSDEVYKGIADGNGRGVFNGKIIVQPGTAKIVATQASHNLLLSSEAEIDTKPELEIYADDLRCAHGATVGQLDDDAMFYLQARGVPAAEARALLTYGFVQAAVATIPFPELQALVARRFATDNPGLARLLAGDLS